jgi:hypothetical protein
MSENEKYKLEDHPIMKRYIFYYKKLNDVKTFYSQWYSAALFSFVSAPFYTISILRQLSIPAHKEIYGDYNTKEANSKDVMKISNEITLRDARNAELIKSSGVLEGSKPYRAPIYDNYFQTIKGAYRQGILGFYKGNFCRLLYHCATMRFSISLRWFVKEREENFNLYPAIRDFICLTLSEIVCHPVFVAENRFVLQNRLPNFQIYPTLNRFRTRIYEEMYFGSLGHIPKNIFFLAGFYFYFYLLESKTNFTAAYLFGTTLSYPILMSMRRIVCQTSRTAGMLPLRYINLAHAFFLIRREEGIFKGLYKGYFAYIIATLIWIYSLRRGGEVYLMNKLKEDENIFGNDPVFLEIQKRKMDELKGIIRE